MNYREHFLVPLTVNPVDFGTSLFSSTVLRPVLTHHIMLFEVGQDEPDLWRLRSERLTSRPGVQSRLKVSVGEHGVFLPHCAETFDGVDELLILHELKWQKTVWDWKTDNVLPVADSLFLIIKLSHFREAV